MKENAYMSLDTRTIIAQLKVENSQDVLVFVLDRNYTIHLRSETSQIEIKTVFSALLECLLKQPIKVALDIDKAYDNNLLKDVCTAYIGDLNNEIDQIAHKIPVVLTVNS